MDLKYLVGLEYLVGLVDPDQLGPDYLVDLLDLLDLGFLVVLVVLVDPDLLDLGYLDCLGGRLNHLDQYLQ